MPGRAGLGNRRTKQRRIEGVDHEALDAGAYPFLNRGLILFSHAWFAKIGEQHRHLNIRRVQDRLQPVGERVYGGVGIEVNGVHVQHSLCHGRPHAGFCRHLARGLDRRKRKTEVFLLLVWRNDKKHYTHRTMDTYEHKLKQFIAAGGIEAEHLSFEQSCHSVAEAAAAVGTDPEHFVKISA